MNRIRAWIDADDWHLLIANLALSQAVILTLWLLTWTILEGWRWSIPLLIILVPLEAFWCVAQLTNWRRR